MVISPPLMFRVELLAERSEVMMEQYDVVASDGEWHHLNLVVTRDQVVLRLDNTTSVQSLPQHIRTGLPSSHPNVNIM